MSTTLNEIPIFLYCLRTGLLAGILYEMLAIIRLHGNKYLSGVTDVVYAVIVSVGAWLTLLYCNNGKIRLYEISAMVLGAIIVHKYPGKLIKQGYLRLKLKLRR